MSSSNQMLPTDLHAEHFAAYPPQARKLAVASLPVLQHLPLTFLPSLLRELIEYDYKFPVERAALDRELAQLRALTPAQTAEWFQAFSQITLSPVIERSDWAGQPTLFTDQLSAYLWSTHQMDAFRKAATEYGNRLRTASGPLPMQRLGIAVIGQGVASYDAPLFRKLREHGTCFNRIDPTRGLDHLLEAVSLRARAHPEPYTHWYVDGGNEEPHSPLLTSISYESLKPAREALLKHIQNQVQKPGMGPEDLHANLVKLSPAELGMNGEPLLDRFKIKLLTEGSGTQIFSTTFAQWTAREVLRRAEALTLLVRFAPRQRERPMSELLSSTPGTPELDPRGSLIDADMGAYYHWINQQRLPGSDQSSFIVWFEGHRQAIALSPHLPQGAKSTSEVDLKALLALAIG